MAQVKFLARINPFAFTSAARVRGRWRETEHVVRHWTQIPTVLNRLNERVTGRPDLTFKDLVCRDYFGDCKVRTALSLGCGNGERERDWARRGVFSKMTALDLSPTQIASARKRTAEEGLSEVLEFRVADVNQLAPNEQQYDVVIFEHSLHHFRDIPSILRKVRQLLKPNGLMLLDEFIGPRRFQWLPQQLAFANAVLLCLPETYRRFPSGNQIKARILRAGELLMWLNDPSEAVESDRIATELQNHFNVLRRFNYGGTISHLIFHDIAHNFVLDQADGPRLARLVLDTEDVLLDKGLIQSDFACFVCAPQ